MRSLRIDAFSARGGWTSGKALSVQPRLRSLASRPYSTIDRAYLHYHLTDFPSNHANHLIGIGRFIDPPGFRVQVLCLWQSDISKLSITFTFLTR